MITRSDYERYLERFHAKDYAAVLQYYAPDLRISFAGISLQSPADVKRFYAFFHSYVEEEIVVEAFAASDELVALEAQVRLTGLRELTAETLPPEYAGLVGPPVGRTLTLPQYIHYRLRDGKFVSADCLLTGEPRLSPDP